MDVIKTVKLTEEEKEAIKVLCNLTDNLYNQTHQCKKLNCSECSLNIFCVDDIEDDDKILNAFTKELNNFLG